MPNIAKTLISIGFVFILIGILVSILQRFLPVGRLPGDVFIKKDNFSIYFPVTTCILLSLIISLIAYLWQQR